MPTHAIAAYATLRRKVKETLLLGQERIEREKVRTYWETGRLINEYLAAGLKPGQTHADRGKQIVMRLAGDLEIGDKVLYRCMRFAEAFPYFSARRNKELTWSHYRALITVSDEDRREALAERAARLEWGSRDLEVAVKRVNQKNGAKLETPQPLEPKKGVLYTYRLVRSDKIHPGRTDLRVDLGFSSYLEASMKGAENLKAGEIAVSEWVKADTYRLAKAAGGTEADLFTYYAYIERVVDGDTLLVQVDLGFGLWTRQYLRLRGIDAPEMDSNGGRKAKHFTQAELSGVPYIVITSSRSDKYDRYLADIFYETKAGEQHLNNRLLQEHLANRV